MVLRMHQHLSNVEVASGGEISGYLISCDSFISIHVGSSVLRVVCSIMNYENQINYHSWYEVFITFKCTVQHGRKGYLAIFNSLGKLYEQWRWLIKVPAMLSCII